MRGPHDVCVQLLFRDDPDCIDFIPMAAERVQLSQAAAGCLQGWGENDRGVSYTFGPDSVMEFLQKHDLDLVCRAHQVTHSPRQQSESPTAAPKRLVVNCTLCAQARKTTAAGGPLCDQPVHGRVRDVLNPHTRHDAVLHECCVALCVGPPECH